MPPIVLRCPDKSCGVIVQTSQMLAGLACPRCHRIFRPMQRPTTADSDSAVSLNPPLVLRCSDVTCGLIVRASLAPGESLPCPRCFGPLEAVAPLAPKAPGQPPAPAPSAGPDATLVLPASGSAVKPPPLAVSATSAPTTPPDDTMPQRIGRFKIMRFLGEGGFGRVYEAYDPALKRAVALKVPRSEQIQTPERVRRFLGEAQSAAKLMHPHVVAVFDSGQDGLHHYIATAYVSGQPLNQALRQKPGGFGLREAVEIVRKLAEALAYAHHEGVIHRDVKPGNVMLRDDGEPLLMDFGLAARLEAGEERLTQGQVAMGTPGYMAPEQCKGEAVAASDQYSLGVTLYELLTGQLPFSGGSAAHLMVLHETQPPPSPRQYRPDVPRDLEAICLRCLEKEVARRYPDCQALADDLRHWAAGEPVTARLPGPIERLRKWSKRNPAVSVLTAVVAATLLLGTMISTGLAIYAKAEAKRADQAAADATREAKRADEESQAAIREAKRADEEARTARRLAQEQKEARERAEHSEKQAKAQSFRAEIALHANQLAQALAAWDSPLPEPEQARRMLDSASAEFQHAWEQRYTRAYVGGHAPCITFYVHNGDIHGVAFSSDGKYVATGSQDRTVCLWDARTGERKFPPFAGHAEDVYAVACSPAGQTPFTITSASKDRTLKTWDGQTGKLLHTLSEHTGSVWAVAYSPDGSTIVSASGDKTVKLWDARTGKRKRTFDVEHTNSVFGVAYRPDGKRIVSCGHDAMIKVWDPETGKSVLTLRGHTKPVSSVAYSHDGTRIVSAGEDRAVKVWDAQTGKEIHSLEGHSHAVMAALFSPDGNLIVSSSNDKTVKLWDPQTGQLMLTLKGHTGGVRCVAYSPSDGRIATAGTDDTLKVWDPHVGPLLRTIKVHTEAITCVASSSNGKLIASASRDRTVRVWDTATAQVKLTLPHPQPVTSVAFCGDALLATGCEDRTVTVWDRATGKQKYPPLTGHAEAVLCVASRPDGKRIVSGSADKTLMVWDAESGKNLLTLKGHDQAVTAVAYNPDGKHVLSASRDRSVKVWDAESGKPLLSLDNADEQTVTAVAYSHDGERIVSGGTDRTIKVWDARTGTLKLTLKGHADGILSVVGGSDGRIVSGSADQTVKVWSATGTLESTLEGHSDGVTGLCRGADGRIVSGGADKTLRVWDPRAAAHRLTLTGQGIGTVHSVAYGSEGKRLATGHYDGKVRLWDAETGQLLNPQPDKGHLSGITAVAYRPDGKQVASVSYDSSLKIWDAQSGKVLRTLKEHTHAILCLAYRSDGKRLVTGGLDNLVKVWDLQTDKVLLTFEQHAKLINAVTYSPDGTRIASSSSDGKVRIWDAETGKQVLVFEKHASGVTGLAYSPDGQTIASADRIVKVWDARTGEEKLSFPAHPNHVKFLIYSPKGKRLVTGSEDQTAKVWDAQTGQLKLTLKGHSAGVVSAAYRDDGRYLAWACANSVRIWNVAGDDR